MASTFRFWFKEKVKMWVAFQPLKQGGEKFGGLTANEYNGDVKEYKGYFGRIIISRDSDSPALPLMIESLMAKAELSEVLVGDTFYQIKPPVAKQERRNFIVEHYEHNNFVRVENIKTGEYWHLQPCEFVYGSSNFNEVVDSFPKYVHKKVWELSDAHAKRKKDEKND